MSIEIFSSRQQKIIVVDLKLPIGKILSKLGGGGNYTGGKEELNKQASGEQTEAAPIQAAGGNGSSP